MQISNLKEIFMNTISKLATFALLVMVMTACALAQAPAGGPQVTVLSNLTEGQAAATGNASDWEGWSELDLIPGAALFGVTTKATVLTLGFSSGSTATVSNMVLYTTNRSSNLITATKKVTLGAKANPIINLASTSVCPVQPVSVANPCFVKLDAIKEALSPSSDYYFVIYFTSDSGNNAVRGAGSSSEPGALSGWLIDGDDTRIPVAGTIPVGYNGAAPVFLMYATNE
jgi:hypothetical protein